MILLPLYEFLFLSSGYSSGHDLLQALDEEHERQSTQQYCDGLMSENHCGWDGNSEQNDDVNRMWQQLGMSWCFRLSICKLIMLYNHELRVAFFVFIM